MDTGTQLPELPGYDLRAELSPLRPEVRRFAAVQRALQRDVEIRLLAEPAGGGSEAHLRFRQECQALLVLDHPAVIKVLDVGVAHGRLFYVTDLRDAATLAELMSRGQLPPEECLRMAVETLDGLDRLHRGGMLLRRIDACSIFLDRPSGHWFLGDFSLLRRLASASLTEAGVPLFEGLPVLPEGRVAADLDTRSDLFLVGATLYQALTGRDPWPQLRAAIKAKEAPALEPVSASHPELARGLDDLLAGALSFEPLERPATAADFAAAIERLRGGMRARAAAEAARRPVPPSSSWARPSRRTRSATAPQERSSGSLAAAAAGALVVAGAVLFAARSESSTAPPAPRPARSKLAPLTTEQFAELAAQIASKPTGPDTFLRRWEQARRYFQSRPGPEQARVTELRLAYYRDPARGCRELDALVAAAAGERPGR